MSTALIARQGSLVSVAKAREILAHCKTVDAAKDVKDRARAVAIYLRDKKDATAARDDAFEIALRAERRMGEILARTPLSKGGKPVVHGRRATKVRSTAVTLKSLGVTPHESKLSQKLAALPEQEFDGRIRTARAKEKLSVRSVLALTSATDHDGDAWMTPDDYAAKAQRVLGGIDLDPASTPEANNVIKARRFFTAAQDGLKQAWTGKVWLNPPFSNPLCGNFVAKLIEAHRTGAVPRAILLVNAATDVSWFHDLLAHFPVCFTKGRMAFVQPGGSKVKGNMYGQAFFFLGCDRNVVRREFATVGTVLERSR